jgi:hypothetical protein
MSVARRSPLQICSMTAQSHCAINKSENDLVRVRLLITDVSTLLAQSEFQESRDISPRIGSLIRVDRVV